LNVTPTGVNTFLTAILRPETGWTAWVNASSSKDCWTSMVSPVLTNLYTYVGMEALRISARG
jgi:hypothetical protein